MEAPNSSTNRYKLKRRETPDQGDRLRRYEKVDEQAIHVMVHTFYGCIRQHPRLGASSSAVWLAGGKSTCRRWKPSGNPS